MALEPLPDKEIKTTAGFSAYPSTLEKLDVLAEYLGGNRSETVCHLIETAFAQLKESQDA